jgi:hypothetical protein
VGVHLNVRYTHTHPEEVRVGVVAAWKQVPDPDDPSSPRAAPGEFAWTGGGHYALAGYADPIKAAQLLEEAVRDDGYVWILSGTDPVVRLDNLVLIWGADILDGRVCNDGPGVGDDIHGYPTETPTTSP